MKLKGKLAWVTGAGSGIGEAPAVALANEGAALSLTGRTRAKLEAVASRIREKGGKAHVQPADLMQPSEVEKIGRYIQNTINRLDILVNNAGLNVRDRSWHNLTSAGV